jgi:4a-hydroxytetrahydrobiopterin dehydratase
MTTPLAADERAAFIAEHPDWALDGETLSRTFVFSDFAAAMGFVTSVAVAAEHADHHPDIDVRWNKVTLTLTTHSAGALTAKDTSLAAAADGYA